MKNTEKRIDQLSRKIDQTKKQIAQLGDLRPGSLSKQYNVCGNPRCRCKDSPPKKHGPYYQLSFTRKGKGTTRFIRKDEVVSTRKELENYAKLRELVDRWIELATELSDLKRASRRSR